MRLAPVDRNLLFNTSQCLGPYSQRLWMGKVKMLIKYKCSKKTQAEINTRTVYHLNPISHFCVIHCIMYKYIDLHIRSYTFHFQNCLLFSPGEYYIQQRRLYLDVPPGKEVSPSSSLVLLSLIHIFIGSTD